MIHKSILGYCYLFIRRKELSLLIFSQVMEYPSKKAPIILTPNWIFKNVKQTENGYRLIPYS
jgi:hypothetical protein